MSERQIVMKPADWIGALANAWWLGHRDVCNDCNCRPEINPYHLKSEGR